MSHKVLFCLDVNESTTAIKQYLHLYFLNLKCLRATWRIKTSHFLFNPLDPFLCLLRCFNSSLPLFNCPTPCGLGSASYSFPFWLPPNCCYTIIAILPSKYMTVPVPSPPPDLTTDIIHVCHLFNFLIANPLLPSRSSNSPYGICYGVC